MYFPLALIGIYVVLVGFVWLTEGVGWLVSRALGLGVFRLMSVNPARRSSRSLWVSAALILAPLLPIWLVGALVLALRGSEVTTPVVDVSPGPAWQAGVRDGDRVVSIARHPTPDFNAILTELRANPGPAELVVDRQGQRLEFLVPRDENGRIGVRGRNARVGLPASDVATQAVLQPFRVVGAPLMALGGKKEALMGPVGIVRETRTDEGSKVFAGLQLIVLLACYIWIGFALAVVLDVVTLPLFRRLSPDVLSVQTEAEFESFRIARLRQQGEWLLVAFFVGGVFAWVLELTSSSAPSLNLLAFAFGPALILSSWSLARALYGTRGANLILLLAPLPCLNLACLSWLMVLARKALAARGLRAGFLRTKRVSAA